MKMAFRLFAIFAAASAGLLATAAVALDMAPMRWQAMPDKSSIEWSVVYGQNAVNGAFKSFTAEIVFDPDHLDKSSVIVKIDTAKVTSDDKDAQETLPTADWFDSAKFPQAVFEASKFKHIADETYEAEGTLTLAGKTNPVTLPFNVHFYEDKESTRPVRFAQVTAETMLKRTDYGVGKGEWASTGSVGDSVKVTISLKAREPEPDKPAAQPQPDKAP